MINWLQDWYKNQCNDEWEHDYGITIGTLDNPGWDVKIDLIGTSLEGFEILIIYAKELNNENLLNL